MHVLGMSILLAWSSTSFAELVVNNSPVASGTNGSASLNWSANDASQLMEEDESLEISPQGSTSVTTTLRSGGSATITSSSNPKNTKVQIRDTFSNSINYSSQPSVNARAALVMDAQTGEVLYSKNSNMSVPIASITKLMTAVVTACLLYPSDAADDMQCVEFGGCRIF